MTDRMSDQSGPLARATWQGPPGRARNVGKAGQVLAVDGALWQLVVLRKIIAVLVHKRGERDVYGLSGSSSPGADRQAGARVLPHQAGADHSRAPRHLRIYMQGTR